MKLKFEDVELEIRKLAREFPDRKAECTYVRDGEPMCIFGHALHRLGVSTFELAEYDAADDSVSASDLIDTDDLAAMRWANNVQTGQDRSAPWRIAVDFADRWAGR